MTRFIRSIGLFTGAALLVAATPLVAKVLTLEPSSKVWVAGSSTVRDFKCESSALTSKIQSPDGATQVAGLVSDATVGLDVARLDCGNGTMNEHMQKALKMKEFPKISFKLDDYTVNGKAITLKGRLTLAGQERPVQLVGTLTEDGELVRTTATARINMKDWGVKPPTLMMGTMKVKELATIGYDVSVKR